MNTRELSTASITGHGHGRSHNHRERRTARSVLSSPFRIETHGRLLHPLWMGGGMAPDTFDPKPLGFEIGVPVEKFLDVPQIDTVVDNIKFAKAGASRR